MRALTEQTRTSLSLRSHKTRTYIYALGRLLSRHRNRTHFGAASDEILSNLLTMKCPHGSKLNYSR